MLLSEVLSLDYSVCLPYAGVFLKFGVGDGLPWDSVGRTNFF